MRKAGGIGIYVGNAALLANGLIAALFSQDSKTKTAGYGRVGTAVLWGFGGVGLAKYGSQAVPDQLTKLENKLADFLQKEGVPLDAEILKKADVHQRRNWFQKIEDFIYNYPIECTNAYYALASTGMLISGIVRLQSDDKSIRISGQSNIATSALVVAGSLVSILVPERTKEQIAARGQQGTLWGKIQERPLDYAVWTYMGSDLFTGLEAKGEWSAAKNLDSKDPFKKWAYAMPILSVFAMSCALFSDIVTGFSSKKAAGTDEDRNAAQQQLIHETAAILASLPVEKQLILVKSASEFLATQPELRMTNFDPKPLEERIIHEIAQYTANKEFDPAQGTHSAKILAEAKNSYSPLLR